MRRPIHRASRTSRRRTTSWCRSVFNRGNGPRSPCLHGRTACGQGLDLGLLDNRQNARIDITLSMFKERLAGGRRGVDGCSVAFRIAPFALTAWTMSCRSASERASLSILVTISVSPVSRKSRITSVRRDRPCSCPSASPSELASPGLQRCLLQPEILVDGRYASIADIISAVLR